MHLCTVYLLYIPVAPYNVEITGTRRYLYGSDIELNCASKGGRQLEYIWTFLDNTIDNDAMLNINSATVSNGGNYICNVTNIAGSDINTTTVYSELSICTYVIVTLLKFNVCDQVSGSSLAQNYLFLGYVLS